jgi:hypothetical protein
VGTCVAVGYSDEMCLGEPFLYLELPECEGTAVWVGTFVAVGYSDETCLGDPFLPLELPE